MTRSVKERNFIVVGVTKEGYPACSGLGGGVKVTEI
jgi:hypothetical protein